MTSLLLPLDFRVYLVEKQGLSASTAALYAAAVTALLRAGENARALAAEHAARVTPAWRCASDTGWRHYRRWCREEGIKPLVDDATLDAIYPEPAELPPAVAMAVAELARILTPKRLLHLRWRMVSDEGVVSDAAGNVDAVGNPLVGPRRIRLMDAMKVLMTWGDPSGSDAFVVPLAPRAPQPRGQRRLKQDIARGALLSRTLGKEAVGLNTSAAPLDTFGTYKTAVESHDPAALREADRAAMRAAAEAKAESRRAATRARIAADPLARFVAEGMEVDKPLWLDTLTGAVVTSAERIRILAESYGIVDVAAADAQARRIAAAMASSTASDATALSDSEANIAARLGRPLTKAERLLWGFAKEGSEEGGGSGGEDEGAADAIGAIGVDAYDLDELV